ncbi:MAG: Radical domain protein [Firmicutes bacterium]|nr:Radical domain protein [Bacillota bacterium]
MSYKSNLGKVKRIEEAVDFPKVILLDNTSACNLRCSMCDHRNITKYRKIQMMDMGLYKKIIDEIAVEKPSARIWEIFFGDPFLCRDMPERISYAKDKGCEDVVLNTNGVLMKAEWSRQYIEAGLDAIYVGIDAANKETYEQIRIGGDFEKAVQNVIAYRDLLKNYGKPSQKLFVQFVVSEVNEEEVEVFKRFWNEKEVNVKIRPKISWAGLVKAENLIDNETIQRRPCYWLMQTMNICADGRVALCSVDLHCRVPSGDVTQKSLKEVWKDGVLSKYRNMHSEGRYEELPEMCRLCSDWQSAYADYVLY